ncbi:MAG: amidohydrolase family protein, partial [Planctomycetaceae bacterium]|nr:amidohydrolase family protein [Planctomycetaceae bacterium]
DDASWRQITPETPRTVIFREILGIGDDIHHERLETARRFLARRSVVDNQRVRLGLSPHAPYSLSTDLFQQVVQMAIVARAPVAMHLAETREELELLSRGTGPLADLLKDFGVWRDGFWFAGESIMEYLRTLSLAPRALVVHGNYLTTGEIDFLASQPQMSVVYCPRTHHNFGHTPHPWRTMLERGINVALGTDSRASNPDLSLWREIQFLHQLEQDVPSETLLQMATRHGAAALGLDEECGSLQPGRWADLTVIALSDDALAADRLQPYDAVLHPGNQVVACMSEGRWLHR